MADVETPVQVGFAEFIARLMSEVFDSVITSQVDQEQRYAQMVTSAAMDPEEYGARYLSDADIAGELVLLFPARKGDKESGTAIYAGSPYDPGKETGQESPPISDTLGISLAKADVEKSGDGLVLSETGVETVTRAVRTDLAARHLAMAGQIVARGLPRVVVDSGKINGKLTFQLTETNGPDTPEATEGESREAAFPSGSLSRTASLADTRLGSVFTLPKARILPNVKLMVRQADDTSPQSSQVKANVYGEVEITFKTVT